MPWIGGGACGGWGARRRKFPGAVGTAYTPRVTCQRSSEAEASPRRTRGEWPPAGDARLGSPIRRRERRGRRTQSAWREAQLVERRGRASRRVAAQVFAGRRSAEVGERRGKRSARERAARERAPGQRTGTGARADWDESGGVAGHAPRRPETLASCASLPGVWGGSGSKRERRADFLFALTLLRSIYFPPNIEDCVTC